MIVIVVREGKQSQFLLRRLYTIQNEKPNGLICVGRLQSRHGQICEFMTERKREVKRPPKKYEILAVWLALDI